MADLSPPARISPVIKFGRWSFLIAGILYGAAHQKRLTKKEAKIRVVEDQKKAVRDAQLAAEKKRRAEEEIKSLEEMAGVKSS